VQAYPDINSISIIGAGNVGSHLAIALKNAGYEIKHIVARNPKLAGSIKKLVDTEVLTSIKQVRYEPDMYLICVQDAEIHAVAESLLASDKIIVHTSGAIDMSVFSGKRNAYGVFYPLQTFTRELEMIYSDIPFLLEADNEHTLNALTCVAQRISGNYSCISAPERLRLHLAAVFACNFSNHMASIADYLLKQEGLDLELIRPLMRQTLKKLDTLSPKEAQTGPAVRGDEKTMSRHLEELSSEPELEELYKLISKSIQNKF